MTATPEFEVKIVRIFDAPRELVFKVWIEPEHQARWLYPDGWTMLGYEADTTEGGQWRSRMLLPDGKPINMRGEFREITPPERLIYTHTRENADGSPTHWTMVHVELAEKDGKTLMNFSQAKLSSEEWRERAAVLWNQEFDHLEGYLKG